MSGRTKRWREQAFALARERRVGHGDTVLNPASTMSFFRSRSPAAFHAAYGPLAVVTGASDGIGRAIASALAARGFGLVLTARRAVLLDEIAADLRRRHGVEVRTIALDLAEATAPAALLAATEGDDVGLLVAAAGYGGTGAFLDRELAGETNMLDVNVRASLMLAHGFGRRFAARGHGGIVLFGSVLGWQGAPFAATYAATKSFVQSFAEGLHGELASRGVDVLSCAPGPVRTGFHARAGMAPRGAFDAPDTVAEATLAALGRRGTVVPGLVGRVVTAALSLLPRRLRVLATGRAMRNAGQPGRPTG